MPRTKFRSGRARRGKTKRRRTKRRRTKRRRTKRRRTKLTYKNDSMRGGDDGEDAEIAQPVPKIFSFPFMEGKGIGIVFEQKREELDHNNWPSKIVWWPQVSEISPNSRAAEMYPELTTKCVLLSINGTIAPTTFLEGFDLLKAVMKAGEQLDLGFTEPQNYTVEQQKADVLPTHKVTIQSGGGGRDELGDAVKYCELNGQKYYIGFGAYRKGSNRTCEFYKSIFLPFYGFANDEEKTGTLYKTRTQAIDKRPTSLYMEGDDTIHSLFTKLIAEDGMKEMADKDMAGKDMIYMTRETKGYSLITAAAADGGALTIMNEASVVAVMNNLNDIFGDVLGAEMKGLIIKYVEELVSKMTHVDVELYVGDVMPHPAGGGLDPYGCIPEILKTEMNFKNAEIMYWLGRYSTADNYQQLRDSMDLTYSLMVRYPAKAFSYRTEFPWIDYIRKGGSYIDFDFE